MATYRLVLEYDGSGFHGWQAQAAVRTVEGVLREAVARVCREQPLLSGAGRTDSGAHAHGQAASLALQGDWEPQRLRGALNGVLPEDVVVRSVERAADGFHARRDALWRTYRYLVVERDCRAPVLRRHAWVVRGPLDAEAMRAAALRLWGRHDFAALGSPVHPGGSTVRTLRSVDVVRSTRGDGADGVVSTVITVVADAFLRGMMRGIAGLLVAVGQGRLQPGDVDLLLADASRRRAQLTVAPAHGLHQWAVAYPAEAA